MFTLYAYMRLVDDIADNEDGRPVQKRLDELEARLARSLSHALTARRSLLGDYRTRLWQASPVTRVQQAVARHAALSADRKSVV